MTKPGGKAPSPDAVRGSGRAPTGHASGQRSKHLRRRSSAHSQIILKLGTDPIPRRLRRTPRMSPLMNKAAEYPDACRRRREACDRRARPRRQGAHAEDRPGLARSGAARRGRQRLPEVSLLTKGRATQRPSAARPVKDRRGLCPAGGRSRGPPPLFGEAQWRRSTRLGVRLDLLDRGKDPRRKA